MKKKKSGNVKHKKPQKSRVKRKLAGEKLRKKRQNLRKSAARKKKRKGRKKIRAEKKFGGRKNKFKNSADRKN